MEESKRIRDIICRLPELADRRDVLYEKFVRIYGKDDSVKKIVESIVVKAYERSLLKVEQIGDEDRESRSM